jgi:protein gp37
MDKQYGRDSNVIAKTSSFNLPVKRNRMKEYKLAPRQTVYTCLTSDFFLEEADAWRKEAWRIIRERQDLHFSIITKRIHRFPVSLPADWGTGYDNVSIYCTVENQARADSRLPLFLELPIKHRVILCEPLLGFIDMNKYLSPSIEEVVVGGESGTNARICCYEWVLHLREQCLKKSVPFRFRQTGMYFQKEGRLYVIPRLLQKSQAEKAGIDLN